MSALETQIVDEFGKLPAQQAEVLLRVMEAMIDTRQDANSRNLDISDAITRIAKQVQGITSAVAWAVQHEGCFGPECAHNALWLVDEKLNELHTLGADIVISEKPANAEHLTGAADAILSDGVERLYVLVDRIHAAAVGLTKVVSSKHKHKELTRVIKNEAQVIKGMVPPIVDAMASGDVSEPINALVEQLGHVQALADSSTEKEHFKGTAWTLADWVADLAREGLGVAASMGQTNEARCLETTR